MPLTMERTLSRAGALLGQKGGHVRWQNSTQRERIEFAKMGAASRWPSYRKALEMELEREREYEGE